METTTSRHNWLNFVALLLSLPTAYFILISVLKYGLGIDGPFDSITPALESWGIKESLGWNINLLILFGPVLACLITAFQVLRINWHFSKEQLEFRFTILRKWFPLSVAIGSAGLLMILFVYVLGENCQCS